MCHVLRLKLTASQTPVGSGIDLYIKYSLDFLCPITTSKAFEAVDWLADLPQQTWPQAGQLSDGHFVEVNSRNLGGGHIYWGSYHGINFTGWRGHCGFW